MDKKEEFLKKIMATFRIEAEETINAMSADLIELEKAPKESHQQELIEVIYRASHSLKGAARAVNFSDIESLCHAFEDVMTAIRSDELKISSEFFTISHQTVDLINKVLHVKDGEVSQELYNTVSTQIGDLTMFETGFAVESKGAENIPEPETESDEDPEIVEPAAETQEQEKVGEQEVTSEHANSQEISKKRVETYSKKTADKTIRISTQKLDNLLFQVEEMLSLKLSVIQRTEYLQSTLNKLSIWDKEFAGVFASILKIKQFLDEEGRTLSNEEKEMAKIIHFNEWASSHIKNIEKELSNIRSFSQQEVYSTGSKIETLLDDVRELITVPFSTLLNGFPKMVRDIASDLEKGIDFTIKGDDVEIDRRILEKLRNPLIHILRNSIDYGIEKPYIRIKNKKSIKGNITLKIERLENNKVELSISDDGVGVNLEKLKQLYIKNKGIAEKDIEKITEKECLDYMFVSGISTSDIVTDLSGRGLGLAIVKDSIEQLGGEINIETTIGKSTNFRILLPTSIITFRGVLFELSGREFIIPTSKVHKVIRLNKKEIKTIENKATIPFAGKIIPLLNLSEILELPVNEMVSEFVQIVVFEIEGKQIGFLIDNIIGDQDVLVKNFNKQLAHVRNISGATILGSGKVVPILNISDLFKSSLKTTISPRTFTGDKKTDKEAQKSILIVEDSITSRTLLKNILESAGYQITTAIDGIDGFTKLKEGSFDAIVTDIEMPRMNGFELTAKIRADKDCAELPIVLVTTLSKREDKEKGIDVGANAYIIKSSFNQSTLLETLDRLI